MIFGPMFQVGCASASSGVTFVSSSRVRPRNGPPLAVSTRLSGSPSCAHWKSAECSLSTGISAPPPRSCARERELAGGDEALLVRERERDAALERPHRRREPGEADDGVEHEVGLGALEQLGEVAADLRERREPVDRLRARRRGDELELGVRVDHLDRLAPDRAGRAEQGDPLHRRVRVPTARSVRRAAAQRRRRGCRSTPPARRTAARRCGRACRRGRRAACRCPSPACPA